MTTYTPAVQFGFPGLADSHVAGDIPTRIAYLLSQRPVTRDSYPRLVFEYWLEFDGLSDILPPEQLAALRDWMERRATSWKTIQNRAGEVQNQIPALEATPDIADRRRQQAKQGRVR